MSLIYDGLDITRFAFVRMERPVAAEARYDTEQVPGRDGEALVGATMAPVRIVAHCTLRASYLQDWRDLRDQMAAEAARRTPARLELPGEPGRWRQAMLSAPATYLTPETGPLSFDLEFYCHDPVAYGRERRAKVPSGGSVVVDVGGTLPCPVAAIYCAAATPKAITVDDATTYEWGLAVGDSVTHVPFPSASASSVAIDCDARTVEVSGGASMITLGSDWPWLVPGTNEVRMDAGTGAATIAWVERWL